MDHVRALLAEWRTEPRTLAVRLKAAQEAHVRPGEIRRLTGLNRAAIRRILHREAGRDSS